VNWEFLRPAEEELEKAARYYNRRQKGLGPRFMVEFRKAISRIIENPEAWTPISPNARRCLLNKFPYGIIYEMEKDTILIVAVMHLSREPDYWRNRR
jgi:plasmid stabilization system protein ParE